MKIVIVGGGRIGRHLSQRFSRQKHEVVIVEPNRRLCLEMADSLPVAIVCGDGTEIPTLESAGIRDAGCLIAVTGTDQVNLVAAQLAKRRYGVKKVIARVNDPRNMETFRALGVDIPVSSTDTIARMIEQEVDLSQMHLLATLNKGRAAISTLTLSNDSVLRGKTLSEIELPQGTLIISIVRDGKLMIPNGLTVLQAGDELAAVSEGGSTKALVKILTQVEK